ncbi:MAG: metallophosphoesterase [bacterium]|nr:metallophosphoesterase [bacterium]
MLVGIMTDTHENMENIRKAVDFFNKKGVELVLHCGDIISPITFKEFDRLNCRMELVFGNNDGERVFLVQRFREKGTFHVPGWESKLDNKKFIMMHEPVGVEALAESQKYNYIIYGHTHLQDIRKIGKSLIINIGETGGWLNEISTIGILDTVKDEVKVITL